MTDHAIHTLVRFPPSRWRKLVVRKYEGRYFSHAHAAQQAVLEWMLNRCEITARNCGVLQCRMQHHQEQIGAAISLLRYIAKARKMRDRGTAE